MARLSVCKQFTFFRSSLVLHCWLCKCTKKRQITIFAKAKEDNMYDIVHAYFIFRYNGTMDVWRWFYTIQCEFDRRICDGIQWHGWIFAYRWYSHHMMHSINTMCNKTNREYYFLKRFIQIQKEKTEFNSLVRTNFFHYLSNYIIICILFLW